MCVCTYIKRGRGYPSNLLFTNNTYDGYHGNTHHKYFLLFFFFKKKNEKILDSRSDNVQYRLSLYRYNRSITNRWTESNQRFETFHSNQYGGMAICLRKVKREKEEIVRDRERERERERKKERERKIIFCYLNFQISQWSKYRNA